MTVEVAPDLLVTLTGMLVVGVPSLLKPNAPGLIKIVLAPVVITSAITPALGAGSTPSSLLASAVLLVESVYNLTHDATLV